LAQLFFNPQRIAADAVSCPRTVGRRWYL